MKTGSQGSWKRWAAFLAVVLSAAMLVLLLTSGPEVKLAGFFLYMCLACTVVPLPTPPYVIALGVVFDPFVVALVGAAGNIIAAGVEYKVLLWLSSKPKIDKRIHANKTYRAFERFYRRAAFLCLVVSGFTPIPFEPFRLAAIVSRYPLGRYLLAIFCGRFPRYYVVAWLGQTLPITDWHVVALTAVLLLVVVVGVVVERKRDEPPPEDR